jgi:asparagine synthetase B (glutamine-hydrolysing)
MRPIFKGIVFAGVALAIAGCQHTEQPRIIKEQLRTVEVPGEFFNCPVLKEFPESKTLTDRDVARVLATLQKNNLTCYSSVQAIKKHLKNAGIVIKR